MSTATSQQVSFVWTPARAVNAINRRNTYPQLCWMKEWKQGGLQVSLLQPPCPCRAGPFLQMGSRLSNTCSFPGSKQILQSLSWCTFIDLCLPSQKVGCVSLPLPAAVWLQRQCSPCSLVSSAPPACPRCASPAVLGERAACPAPQRHPLKGGCKGQWLARVGAGFPSASQLQPFKGAYGLQQEGNF